ncbi:unnamed protein product, partial [Phaeothamnion confervicola]
MAAVGSGIAAAAVGAFEEAVVKAPAWAAEEARASLARGVAGVAGGVASLPGQVTGQLVDSAGAAAGGLAAGAQQAAASALAAAVDAAVLRPAVAASTAVAAAPRAAFEAAARLPAEAGKAAMDSFGFAVKRHAQPVQVQQQISRIAPAAGFWVRSRELVLIFFVRNGRSCRVLLAGSSFDSLFFPKCTDIVFALSFYHPSGISPKPLIYPSLAPLLPNRRHGSRLPE